MSASRPLLVAAGIEKSYQTAAGAVEVLRGVDLTADEGEMLAITGASGVGKSTVINRLLGEERLETNVVREFDGKGRHTTTQRELILLPGDRGLVIDTPGLREIQLWGTEDGLLDGFSEVEELAEGCRFRDCRHRGEPGCAVRRALTDRSLDLDRFGSYLEQRRELAYLERRLDARARKEEEERWRRITIWYRKNVKPRREGGR